MNKTTPWHFHQSSNGWHVHYHDERGCTHVLRGAKFLTVGKATELADKANRARTGDGRTCAA